MTVYFLGFFVESSGTRWNISTFMGSITIGFLLGVIPLVYFSGMNYRYLFYAERILPGEGGKNDQDNLAQETMIEIGSTLKKEELSFYPAEFIYAESDGNYVDFYLNKNNLVRKEVIRNSIHNIEGQLSGIPWFFRTHRAFIVNLRKVKSKQGNTLGYLIKLDGSEKKIPVSRQNTGNFNRLLARFNS